MAAPESWDKFGNPIAGSRWFNGTPKITERKGVKRWLCPVEPCPGEMRFNGMIWPVNPFGYHHTCSVCGFTAALSGIKFEE